MSMIKAITPTEAVKVLTAHGYKITVNRLQMGLRQRVYPVGDAVEMPGGTWVYAVYSVLLERWIAERRAPNG